MYSEANKISINSSIIHFLSQKAEVPSAKWTYVACVIMGVVLLCLKQPNVSQFLTSHVPSLNPIIESNIPFYVSAFSLVGIGFSGLVNPCTKKAQQKENNLIKLYKRQRSEKLTVENGEIKTMGVAKRVLCFLVPSYRKKHDKQLKKAIGAITSQIKLSDPSNEIEKNFVKEFFFEKLAPLSRKVYKRDLDPSVFNYLASQLNEELDPVFDASENYQKDFQAARIWARLGNFKRPQGGVGGSYAIIEGVTKRCLGIYKPYDEDTLAKNNPFIGQKIKYALAKTVLQSFSQLSFDTVGGQAFIAEAAATKVGQFVKAACKKYYNLKKIETPDVEFVSETHIVNLTLAQKPGRIGSFQLWINAKHETASLFFHTSRHYNSNQETLEAREGKLADTLFDMLVIIDFVTGNFDRHGDNWFIMENGSGIRLIDGGWAMAPRHPTFWNIAELKNQYLWKRLPLADSAFTELGSFVINEIHENKEDLANVVEELYNNHFQDGKRRADRMKERIQVLQNVKDTLTKKELAEIRTVKSIYANLA